MKAPSQFFLGSGKELNESGSLWPSFRTRAERFLFTRSVGLGVGFCTCLWLPSYSFMNISCLRYSSNYSSAEQQSRDEVSAQEHVRMKPVEKQLYNATKSSSGSCSVTPGPVSPLLFLYFLLILSNWVTNSWRLSFKPLNWSHCAHRWWCFYGVSGSGWHTISLNQELNHQSSVDDFSYQLCNTTTFFWL